MLSLISARDILSAAEGVEAGDSDQDCSPSHPGRVPILVET
jgi:hypothetical protein